MVVWTIKSGAIMTKPSAKVKAEWDRHSASLSTPLLSILLGRCNFPAPEPRQRAEHGEMMDWPMAWSLSLQPATAFFLAGAPAFLWLRHLTWKFLPRPLPGLTAAQLSLCTSCIPAACWAWAKPCPGGRQGHLGRLPGSHSSRTWEECLDWQPQTLTDNLQWRVAMIHQHTPDAASYHNYLEMSGSQESSQQKGGGRGRFYNERENTRWGNRKGKQKPLPVWFFPLLWLLPLPSKNAAGCQRLVIYWVWWNWGRSV